MSVELIYKHQKKAYALMKEALRKNGRAAYVFPMGCGKSFLPLKYMEEFPDKKVLLVSPNIGIINQFKRYISTYLLNGKKSTRNELPNFRAITYQKIALAGTIENLKPDVIIFDEIHRMGAENWEPAIDKLISANPNAEIIGMSATPERTDKRNMAYEKFGDSVVYEMSLTEALNGSKENEVVLNGARYARVISALKSDLRQYREQIEQIEDEGKRSILLKKYSELSSIVSDSPDIADIMESAMKKKNGKYIVFCSNREEMFEKMKQVQAIFGKVNSNIRVDYIITKKNRDGKTQKENRLTLEEFEGRERGEALNLLFCVDMLNEGVHLEGVDGEVQFKPTESKIRYKQMVGRVLSSNKEAEETVIIDAVNNWIRQIDTYVELESAVSVGNRTKGESKRDNKNFLRLTDEELELVELLQEIQEGINYQINNTFDEIIRWLETHDGHLPRGNISKGHIYMRNDDLNEEEKYERMLYQRWSRSPEKKILDEYAGVPVSEFPKQLEEYVNKIYLLRSYGLGIKKPLTYDEIIKWLETHDGNMPRTQIYKNNKKARAEDMTEEENYEVNLSGRWRNAPEAKALRACIGIELNDLPEEYEMYREQISKLRGYGLGIKQKPIFEQIIEWLDNHDGEMPHGYNSENGRKLKAEELSDEKKAERNLYVKWSKSKERKALEACKGIAIEDLPDEYIMYREQISKLRSYGLGIGTFEEVINWLETHNGQTPRGMIARKGKRIKTSALTKEEQYERNLYYRMKRLPEFIAYKNSKGISIEDLPEDYVQYRDQIIKFREFEKLRASQKALQKMRTSVGKQVASNEGTRKELSGLVKEVEEMREKSN